MSRVNPTTRVDGKPLRGPSDGSQRLVPPARGHRFAEADIYEARAAVAEYLRDLGLTDPDYIAKESAQIVAEALQELIDDPRPTRERLRYVAVRQTVKKLAHWVRAIEIENGMSGANGAPPGVLGTHLPELLNQHPEALSQDSPPEQLVATAKAKLKPVVPQPRPKPMKKQMLSLLPKWGRTWLGSDKSQETHTSSPTPDTSNPARGEARPDWQSFNPTRGLLAFLTLLSTAAGIAVYWQTIGGVGILRYPLVVLFAVLFFWITFSFWTATLGLVSILVRKHPAGVEETTEPDSLAGLPRSAVLMPIYNEDTASVFANLKAIAKSLESLGVADKFDLFVLSDTTNPDVWLEEERAWAYLATDLAEGCNIYYRHRPKNTSRKAGNIADFCQRWGDSYPYMIVLDADSVMAGKTLVEMVRRMEADSKIGILQVPPTPVSRQSFFARSQQFAARVYGRIFMEGFALWSECDGNYWGHNAIIRIAPFMEHCDLPVLPGSGPLGGEILSHDFVEAALMRRAGWKICLAHDLSGSYEECPTTMLDYAQRDQRWCQGNLQHMGLLLADGFHPASRLHLSMGVMSYISSPLWLLFLALSMVALFVAHGGQMIEQPHLAGWLFGLTMAMLLLPKAWGLIALYWRPLPGDVAAVRHRAWLSVLLETFLSILIAPIMMLLHTQFVVNTLCGTKVNWNAQQRDDRGVSLRDAFLMHWAHTVVGLTVSLILFVTYPAMLLWLSPVLLGLVLSIPLSMLLGSLRVGQALKQHQLLIIPEEANQPHVLRAQQEALALARRRQATATTEGPFALVLQDPAFLVLHLGILRSVPREIPVFRDELNKLREMVRKQGLSAVPADLRYRVQNNRYAMEQLHVLVRSQKRPQSALAR